ALDRLNKSKADVLFVVDQEGSPDGMIARNDLERLAQNGAGGVRKVVNVNLPKAATHTPLNDLYRLCDQGMPIAVVNDHGKLVGSVDPLDILATLAAAEEVAVD